ncbi:MAG: hypothetical protein AAGE52_08120 [Myxococcota bacterium]
MARGGKTYTCPQCGETSVHAVTCHRCDILPLDEQGHPPPPLFERQVLYRRPPEPQFADQRGGGAEFVAIGGYAFSSLARQVRELNRRRRLAARLAGEATPIAAAEGEVHVRGTVEVLEPVQHRQGGDVAAFLFRIREAMPGSDVAIETELGCGKFLVRDESGVALVDDDFFAILPPKGTSFPASGNIDVRIQSGDVIEVVGVAARRALADLPGLGRGGFREAPKVLVFDGRPDSLLVMRPVAG